MQLRADFALPMRWSHVDQEHTPSGGSSVAGEELGVGSRGHHGAPALREALHDGVVHQHTQRQRLLALGDMDVAPIRRLVGVVAESRVALVAAEEGLPSKLFKVHQVEENRGALLHALRRQHVEPERAELRARDGAPCQSLAPQLPCFQEEIQRRKLVMSLLLKRRHGEVYFDVKLHSSHTVKLHHRPRREAHVADGHLIPSKRRNLLDGPLDEDVASRRVQPHPSRQAHQRRPPLDDIVDNAARLVHPAPQDAPALRGVEERLGRVELPVVVPQTEPGHHRGIDLRLVSVRRSVVPPDRVEVVLPRIHRNLEHMLHSRAVGRSL